MLPHSPSTLYVRALAGVLRRPVRAFAFLVATAMHAAGHALLALAAGGLTAALAGAHFSGGAGEPSAIALGFFGLAAVIVKASGGAYAAYVQARVTGDLAAALRLDVLDALLAAHRVHAVGQRDQGASPSLAQGVAALTEHVRAVESGVRVGVLGSVRAVAQLVPLAAVLVWTAPRLALVAAAVLAVFGALLSRARRAWKRANARAAEEAEGLLAASDEAVRHADLWVTYGAQAKARANVQRIGEALTARRARIASSAAALTGANEVLGALALVAALFAARAGWLGPVGEGPRLLAFAVAFFLAYRPLRDLADARAALVRAGAALERLPRSGAVVESGHARSRAWAPATLTVDRLRLARGTLPPISLRVAPGEIVALVGPTGVGKTTLLRTLLGLDLPESGHVAFGADALDGAPAGPLGRPFAWVPQEAPLLADTLAENVSLAADEGRAARAIEMVGARDLARRVNGARLGAAGRALSGGERQWVALARAIATRQPVLLLDEPTSGLDPRAQAEVLAAIARLRGERTVVLVTHRPEPLAIADRVIHLHEGSRLEAPGYAERPSDSAPEPSQRSSSA